MDERITVAGNEVAGHSDDQSAAAQANLNGLFAVAADTHGNVFIADTLNHRIRRVDPGGIITTYAGTGVPGFFGQDVPAVEARFYYPRAVAVDAHGNVFIADTYNHRIRRVDPGGIITTYAGTGVPGFFGQDVPAVE
ncbi:hypothetical protein ACIPK3_33035, partial [Streptomyces sp. NPDC086787]